MPQSSRNRQRLAVALEELHHKIGLAQWVNSPNPRELLEESDLEDVPPAAPDPVNTAHPFG